MTDSVQLAARNYPYLPKSVLQSSLREVLPKDERAQTEATIQQLESRIAALKQSEASSNADVLQEVQDAIDELKIKKATAEDRSNGYQGADQGSGRNGSAATLFGIRKDAH